MSESYVVARVGEKTPVDGSKVSSTTSFPPRPPGAVAPPPPPPPRGCVDDRLPIPKAVRVLECVGTFKSVKVSVSLGNWISENGVEGQVYLAIRIATPPMKAVRVMEAEVVADDSV